MAPTLGFTFILLALVLSLLQPLFSFFWLKFNKEPKLGELEVIRLAKYTTLIVFIFCLASLLCLIYSYIISDFSVQNVYQNSHQLKPLIYKISGSWGNHEGSILLLVTILSFYSVSFAFIAKISNRQKILILSTQLLITFGFIAFVVFTSNPFLRIFPKPLSGLGLNPILQDIGLAMHPPMLYTGYIGFSLVFSFAVTALILGRSGTNFAKSLRPWLTFSWSFLTLGIGLGSWWAYRELGWGGYWFWDPVENVSLMPWLCATALLHSVIILEKNGSFKIWTIFLSILSFVFCLMGIFLVRSGILTSVHSFANDPKRGLFIIFLLLIIGGSGFLIFFLKVLNIRKSKGHSFSLFSRSGLVFINNLILCSALFTVALGTLYPLILQLLANQFISIGPSYYQKILTPLLVPTLILMIFVPYLKLSNSTQLPKRKLLTLLSLLVLIISMIGLKFELKISSLLMITLACFLIFSLLIQLIKLIVNYKAQNQLETYKNSHNKNNKISFYCLVLGHCGFALIVLAIFSNSLFSKSKEANLKVGDKIDFANYQLEFTDLEYLAENNYLVKRGLFKVSAGHESFFLSPESRYFSVSKQTTTEAAIKYRITHDLYLILGEKDQDESHAIRVYFKPLMSLMWLGCLMVFTAGILSITNKQLLPKLQQLICQANKQIRHLSSKSSKISTK